MPNAGNQQRNFEQLYSFIMLMVLVVINILTLKDGHNWGGDFSQYIINAQNIVQHRPYLSGIMIENPFAYPPGFPFLLAPLIKFFGLNFKILKFLNVLFWYSTILVLFPLFQKRLGKETAILCSLLLGALSNFFVFKQNILSDISFMFFVMAAVFTLTQYFDRASEGEQAKGYLAVSLALMAWAFLIRSAGLALFVCAILYSLVIKRKMVPALIFAAVLAGVMGWQTMFMGVHEGFFSVIFYSPQEFFLSAMTHSSMAFRSMLWFFIPAQTGVTQAIFDSLDKVLVIISPAIYLLILIVFVRKVNNRSLSFLGCFFVIYLSVVVLWSGFPHHPSRFARFVPPLLGPGLIYLIEGMHAGKEKFLKGKWGRTNVKLGVIICLFMAILLNVLNITAIFQFNDDVLFREENQQLFSWVKNNIKEGESYISWTPRPIALLTNRVGTTPMMGGAPEENGNVFDRIERLQIKYLLLNRFVDQLLIVPLDENRGYARLVWENKDYRVYQVNNRP